MDEEKLLTEIQILKELLTKYGYVFEETKFSSEDKMKIYRNYFRGRDDIYAIF